MSNTRREDEVTPVAFRVLTGRYLRVSLSEFSLCRMPLNATILVLGQPTDSTFRDEEDAVSLKSKADLTGTTSLPSLENRRGEYPPSQGKLRPRPLDPTIPDGGVRAWLNVLGGFLVLFASFGYTNSWGVYQAYYSQTIYRAYSDSTIAWIGSVQLCLFFVLALVAGSLFDSEIAVPNPPTTAEI